MLVIYLWYILVVINSNFSSLLPDQDHDSFEEMETNVPEEPSDDQEEIEEEEMEEEMEVERFVTV